MTKRVREALSLMRLQGAVTAKEDGRRTLFWSPVSLPPRLRINCDFS